jgi:hypothetical protein
LSDEQAPATEVEDKPTDDAPEEGQASEESSFDYEQAYNELRPVYTQTTQREAQYRTIVEAASNPAHPQHEEAIEYLGFAEEQDEDDEDYDSDPTQALQQELEEIKGYLAERDQEQELQQLEDAEYDWLASEISTLQDKEGVEFDDHELQLLVHAATGNRLQDGQPDLQGAYSALNAAWDARQKNWSSSKRAPQAPSGASAKSEVNLDDPEQRREWMLRRMSEG